MPSTYSPNLRIELIANGEQSGTWGTTTNVNLGSLIEQAITGYEEVFITANPSYLQATDGAVDEARNMIVSLDTSTGGPFSVAIPPREKLYVVINASSYDATIYAATDVNVTTVPSPAGTTVVIPAGKTVILYCEGASYNVKEAINYIASLSLGSVSTTSITADSVATTSLTSDTLSLTTPLPIASGGTGTASTTYCSLSTNVTGTLPVSKGGTGQTTFTDGQLLIGNTTGNTLSKSTLTGTANQVIVTNGNGTITLSTPQNIGTASDVRFDSLGIGTAASGTSGEIRATNNVTAYYSSDRRYKEDIRDIPNALDVVSAIGGKLFSWKDSYVQEKGGEDGYFIQKQDFGVIAQDVQEVFPEAVRTRSDGSLAVDYAKLSALSFAAIKELRLEIESLKGR